MLNKRLRYFDFIFLSICIVFGYWLYVVPTINSFGLRVLFSDDAIAGLQAQRTLRYGASGAYHLTWSPLFPWMLALMQKYLHIAIDDGGILINAWSMVIRVIPMYFYVKFIKNRTAAAGAVIILLSAPMALRGSSESLSQTMQIAIVLIGLYISMIALKKNTWPWYIFVGIIWGVSYMNRLEEWIYIIPFLFFAIVVLISEKYSLNKLYKIALTVLFFIITIFPYLLFVHDAYGSWTLSAKGQIQFAKRGGSFSAYVDDRLGLTTPAQVIFPGDPKYYVSRIWHPPLSEKLYILNVRWESIIQTPAKHFAIMKQELGLLYYLGIIGFLNYLGKMISKNKQITMLTIVFPVTFYYLASAFVSGYDFVSFYKSKFTITYVVKLFLYHLTHPSVFVYSRTIIPIVGIYLCIKIFTSAKLKDYIEYLYQYRLQLYLIAFTLMSILSLIFAHPHINYSMRMSPFFIIFTIIILSEVQKIIMRIYKGNKCKYVTSMLLIISSLYIAKPFMQKTISLRNQKASPDYENSMWKKTGNIIYNDFGGPGALIGLFHEGPAFYAQGEPFYLINDGEYDLPAVIKYLEENNVDYIVATKDEVYLQTHTLKQLLNPDFQLSNWEVIHHYSEDEFLFFQENDTNSIVVIWKKISN